MAFDAMMGNLSCFLSACSRVCVNCRLDVVEACLIDGSRGPLVRENGRERKINRPRPEWGG